MNAGRPPDEILVERWQIHLEELFDEELDRQQECARAKIVTESLRARGNVEGARQALALMDNVRIGIIGLNEFPKVLRKLAEIHDRRASVARPGSDIALRARAAALRKAADLLGDLGELSGPRDTGTGPGRPENVPGHPRQRNANGIRSA